MAKIKSVRGRQVFDSRGNPTVEAPEGDMADADEPSSKKISASTVGFPLLSKTCRPLTFLIFAILLFN